jgi:hypothetical protein
VVHLRGAHRLERRAVGVAHAGDREAHHAASELLERLRQREPDHRQQRFAVRNGQRLRAVDLAHRRENHVLAVDERAVAIKHNQFQWLSHRSSAFFRPRSGL